MPIRNGIVADGLASTISGLLGSMAVDTSSSNIGLAAAARAPKLIQTFFTDPLPTTTILAVILNQVFNVDILCKKVKKENQNILS